MKINLQVKKKKKKEDMNRCGQEVPSRADSTASLFVIIFYVGVNILSLDLII